MKIVIKAERLNHSLKFTPENYAESFQLKALYNDVNNIGVITYAEDASLIIHLPGEDDAN